MSVKTGQISVQTENILPIIKKYLYSDQEIFLRELVSNAMDATSKISVLSNKGEYKGDLGDLTIDVSVDPEAKTITIQDRGLGMTEEEVLKYLNQVAFSSAQEFAEKYQSDNQIIGHFGLGFYSAFMVADKVVVRTKSYKDAPAVQWTNDGSSEYELEEIDKTDRGTEIILHVREDDEEYLQESKIQDLLNKYCKFLPYPIRFGQKTEKITNGEGEDAVTEEVKVDNIVNNTSPLWKKNPADLNDEDYLDFYREIHPYSPEPLFWIHLNIDYPFDLTGVLYFPKLQQNLEVQKNKIHLYSNQVYVTDEVKNIVPEFLTLLHGVIDSPDIPLNVSRSYLQSDRNVKKITGYITKKVAEKLQELFKEDRSGFQQKWDDIGVFVKYGMLSEEKFYEKAENFALLKDMAGNYYTLDEYNEKVSPLQTDKYDKVVHIYANHQSAQDSFVKAAEKEGYNVLLFDTVLDSHFVQMLESKRENVTFVRVDSETPDKLVQKDDSRDSVLSESDIEKVKSLFLQYGGIEENKLELRALSPEAFPVSIVKPEFLRRMEEMQQMQTGFTSPQMEFYNVVVNTNHPLIADKLIKMRSEEKKTQFVSYLYNLAKLNQNMLQGEEMSAFVQQSLEMAK